MSLEDIRKIGSYHNHTTWSDGTYAPQQLVERAIALGIDEIGITDHYFTRKVGTCVTDDKIDAYLAMIRQLRQNYSEKISILAGLEIDTSNNNPNKENLPFDKLNKLDYVLFEYVGDPTWPDTFTLRQLCKIRKNLKIPVGLAHPNLKQLIEKHGAVNLVKILVENDIFVDACGSQRNSTFGLYQRKEVNRDFALNIENLGDEFKQAAVKHRLKFAPSTDTHRDDAYDNMGDVFNASDTLKRYLFQKKKF